MNAPCIKCERKGCGSYHDECETYQEYKRYKQEEANARTQIDAGYADFINRKLYKDRGKNSPFRCHKK